MHSQTVGIIILSILLLVVVILIIYKCSTTCTKPHKYKTIHVPPPTIHTVKKHLFSLVPSYRDQIYHYSIPFELTNEQIMARLVWNDSFSDKLLLEHHHPPPPEMSRSLYIARVVGPSLKANIDLKKPRENHVLPIDLEMLEKILGKDNFNSLIASVGPPKRWEMMKLWLNTTGYTTPMHGDTSNVLAIHLTGRKRWVFADRAYLSSCHPKRNQHGNLYCHASNPYDSSFDDIYPGFKDIQFRHTEWSGGDVLAIPNRFLHFVHTLEPCFMLSVVIKDE